MIEIIGGKLTQWDVGRSLQVTESAATHVHLANKGDIKAVVQKLEDGKVLIPDYLLYTGKALYAYAVLDGVTIETKSFPVQNRERPEGYVYEEDTRNYIYKLIVDAEKATREAQEAAERIEALDLPEFTEADGDLVMKWTAEAPPTDISNVFYRGISLQDIFVTNNIVQGGDFENGIPAIGGVQGTVRNNPVIQSEVQDTGNHALMLDANGTVNYYTLPKHTFAAGHTYYVAFRARVDSHTQGSIGIQTFANTYAATRATSGAWATYSRYATRTSNSSLNAYVGCMSASSEDGKTPILKGYIDNVCILDLTAIFGDSVPTQGQIDYLYDQYIRILRGDFAEERTYVVPQSFARDFSDEACVHAFMMATNRKATALGMTNTNFRTPSGLVVDGNANVSTAADAMKLLISAFGHEKIADVLMQKTYQTFAGGDPADGMYVSNLILTSSMPTNLAADGFYCFGGKGGSLTGISSGQGSYGILNDAILCGFDDKQVAVSFMGEHLYDTSTGERKGASPLMIDIMKKVSGSTAATPNLDAAISRADYPVSVSACVIPAGDLKAWATLDAAKLIEQNGGYSSTPNALHNPASVSKLMTAIVVVENIHDLDERVEIHASDHVGGSGQRLEEGQTYTYWDLLHFMLLESNNNAAHALARAVGYRMLYKGIITT